MSIVKPYKVAILIGRFEPAHRGHFRNLAFASRMAEKVEVIVGSAFQPRTPKNPFTTKERIDMIRNSLWEIDGNSLSERFISFTPIRDYDYNNNLWIKKVQEIIYTSNPGIKDEEIVILGHEKDHTSWYLRAFPNWKFIDVVMERIEGKLIDATKIRELYFEGHIDYIQGAVTPSVFSFLQNFMKTAEYTTLVEEYEFIENYKKMWLAAPYTPTFFTVDAVVIQGGHILMVKRKFAPGKGLWALPGGFINTQETAIESCLRELREETGLKVPTPVLQGSITYEKLFDKPDRSLRGRTITYAYLIELLGGEAKLPRIKGSDDASEANWFSIAEIEAMSDQIFEDHSSIIETMLGRAK